MTRKKAKSGKVLTDDEQMILKVSTYGIEKESVQLPPDAFDTAVKEGVIVKPLYDPLVWALLLEQNTRLRRTIESMALNTVGLGYLLPPKVDEEKYVEQYQTQIEAERNRVRELLDNPNDEDPLAELMKKIKVDEESTGIGYMEISRDGKGLPDGLYHAPAHTMRVLADGTGYVQIRNPAAFPLQVTGKGKKLVDGRGAMRIAELALKKFKDERGDGK